MVSHVARPPNGFFLVHAGITTISAIHYGDGHVKYKEMRDVPIDTTILAFPQFYTLFWQYLKPGLYPK